MKICLKYLLCVGLPWNQRKVGKSVDRVWEQMMKPLTTTKIVVGRKTCVKTGANQDPLCDWTIKWEGEYRMSVRSIISVQQMLTFLNTMNPPLFVNLVCLWTQVFFLFQQIAIISLFLFPHGIPCERITGNTLKRINHYMDQKGLLIKTLHEHTFCFLRCTRMRKGGLFLWVTEALKVKL